MRIQVQWGGQVGYIVGSECHHLTQHIPVMDVLAIQVGLIQYIDTGECDTRIIDHRFGECHKSGDIHTVIGGEVCELGGAFKNGGLGGGGGLGSDDGGVMGRRPDFRKTQIVF